jgi:hypothetical protein
MKSAGSNRDPHHAGVTLLRVLLLADDREWVWTDSDPNVLWLSTFEYFDYTRIGLLGDRNVLSASNHIELLTTL